MKNKHLPETKNLPDLELEQFSGNRENKLLDFLNLQEKTCQKQINLIEQNSLLKLLLRTKDSEVQNLMNLQLRLIIPSKYIQKI
jgi:hypothetical protein